MSAAEPADAIDDQPYRVLIRKPSGEIATFARRADLDQAKRDVAGLRFWKIDAFLEQKEEREARAAAVPIDAPLLGRFMGAPR